MWVMADEAKVEILVLRPANPLAPPPLAASDVTQDDIDALLLKLPEWEDDNPPTSEVLANPISIRVGVAKPRGQEIQRSRITRTDLQPLEKASTAMPAAHIPLKGNTGEASESSPASLSPVASEAGDNAVAGKSTESSESACENKPLARSPQERVRNLSLSDQQKVARRGELADRVALERLYGKAVWETLLNNSRLTPPEVLRISRMGSLPTPLIELIVNNRGWLASPQVRRALLANRRLTKDMLMTVLRATPKSELKLMNKQTAYPALVREAAAKLLSK